MISFICCDSNLFCDYIVDRYKWNIIFKKIDLLKLVDATK